MAFLSLFEKEGGSVADAPQLSEREREAFLTGEKVARNKGSEELLKVMQRNELPGAKFLRSAKPKADESEIARELDKAKSDPMFALTRQRIEKRNELLLNPRKMAVLKAEAEKRIKRKRKKQLKAMLKAELNKAESESPPFKHEATVRRSPERKHKSHSKHSEKRSIDCSTQLSELRKRKRRHSPRRDAIAESEFGREKKRKSSKKKKYGLILPRGEEPTHLINTGTLKKSERSDDIGTVSVGFKDKTDSRTTRQQNESQHSSDRLRGSHSPKRRSRHRVLERSHKRSRSRSHAKQRHSRRTESCSRSRSRGDRTHRRHWRSTELHSGVCENGHRHRHSRRTGHSPQGRGRHCDESHKYRRRREFTRDSDEDFRRRRRSGERELRQRRHGADASYYGFRSHKSKGHRSGAEKEVERKRALDQMKADARDRETLHRRREHTLREENVRSKMEELDSVKKRAELAQMEEDTTPTFLHSVQSALYVKHDDDLHDTLAKQKQRQIKGKLSMFDTSV